MSDQNLSKFFDTVMKGATDQRNKLLQEIELEKKAKIEEQESQILQTIYIDMQNKIADIKNKSSKEISKASFDARRDLLIKRDELTNLVFKDLRDRILQFTISLQYKQMLLDKVKPLITKYSDDKIFIYFKSSDVPFFTNEFKANSNIVIVAGDAISLGGFILEIPDLSIAVNETLDEKYEKQKLVFSEISNLSIF